MTDSSDFLREEYTIETPENVAFGYEVAGIGSRFIGALVDTTLLAVAIVLLNILLIAGLSALGERPSPRSTSSDLGGWVAGLVIALYALINFALIWGYYILFELLWNGQSPGKRLAGIRVVRADGNPAGPIEVVVRNLVRVVDFLPVGYGLGLLTMFFNRRARRLGDFAAGTLVVKERKDITLASLSAPRPVAAPDDTELARVDALLVDYPAMRALTAADYDLILETLRRHQQRQVEEVVLTRLATAIARKVGRTQPLDGRARQVLEEVADLYRRLRLK